VLTACSSSTQEGAIGVQRKQFLLLPTNKLTRWLCSLIVVSYRLPNKKAHLNTDKANLERIRKIADRLIPQAAVFRPEALRGSGK
jgi:hypothetical protein